MDGSLCTSSSLKSTLRVFELTCFIGQLSMWLLQSIDVKRFSFSCDTLRSFGFIELRDDLKWCFMELWYSYVMRMPPVNNNCFVYFHFFLFFYLGQILRWHSCFIIQRTERIFIGSTTILFALALTRLIQQFVHGISRSGVFRNRVEFNFLYICFHVLR